MADEDRQIKYIKVGMEFTNTVTKRILDNLEGQEREEQLDIMKNIQTDYIRMEHEYNTSKHVLAKLKKGLEVENADINKDVEAEYRERLKEELAGSRLQEDDLRSDPRYLQLEGIISGSQPLGDDDLVMTEESETFIDPWSRKPIAEEPVTNRKCKHTYEKATVMKFLEKHSKTRKALKCPIMGCGNNNITAADLYTDPEIKRKVARQNRGGK
eukprot:GFUD01017174.1.p1 GENE.GFUD01017174.1~~GFUD01017174.1.p1  ORF type:complete len:213 (-),score=68.13 GFUD01017174.1:270-908(-)